MGEFVKKICLAFVQNTEMSTKKYMLNFIIGLQQTFQQTFPEDFCSANQHLIYLIISFNENDDLGAQIEKITINQMKCPNFFREILSHKKCKSYFNFLSKINEKLIETLTSVDLALTNSDQTNYCCLLINSIANDLQLMSTNPKLYENLIFDCIKIMSIADLNDCNFEVVEKYLIEGTIGESLSLSVICFDIICQFLSAIESTEIIQAYFIFFQELLLKLCHANCEFNDYREIHLVQILKLMLQMHSNIDSFKDSALIKFFGADSSESADFSTSLAIIQTDPNAKHYHNLVQSISNLREISDQQQKNFCRLIETMSQCNWNKYSHIVNSIINFIALLEDFDKKMLYLLKLNPKSQIFDNIPVRIKQALVILIISFKLKQHSSFDGLNNYLHSIFENLIQNDCTIRRVYFNAINDGDDEGSEIDEIDTIIIDCDELIKLARDLHNTHVCREDKSNFIESTHLHNLQKVLEFSKFILSQQITENECKIIKVILQNFNEACQIVNE